MTDQAAIGRTNKARGKRVEREAARLVGGRRNAETGGTQFDVQTVSAGFEVKSRRGRTPLLLAGAWAQAEAAAAETGLDPYVVLAYTPGRGHKREFWLVRKLA
jgi:hypothetical protein